METEIHPLGFRKYVLASLFGCRIRLHVWTEIVPDHKPHNHRWWFLSVPLFGRFVEHRYREAPSADNNFQKIDIGDRFGIRDGIREYRVNGSSRLALLGTRIRYPMVPYICRSDEIHTLTPRKEGVHVSLVLIGRLRRSTSQMWQDPGLGIPDS